MNLLLLMGASISAVVTIMIVMLNLISKKEIQDREKMAPFECGFDPKTSPRMPFSLQFFLIATIFLVFDVEITLLFPIVSSMKSTSMMNLLIIASSFIVILILGTIHEWRSGALTWKI